MRASAYVASLTPSLRDPAAAELTWDLYSLSIFPHIEVHLQIPPPPKVILCLPLALPPAPLDRPLAVVRIVVTLDARLAPTRLEEMPGKHHPDCDTEREGEDPFEGVRYPRGVVRPGGLGLEGGEEERVPEGAEERTGEDEVRPGVKKYDGGQQANGVEG
jgi:hypothetical protein